MSPSVEVSVSILYGPVPIGFVNIEFSMQFGVIMLIYESLGKKIEYLEHQYATLR